MAEHRRVNSDSNSTDPAPFESATASKSLEMVPQSNGHDHNAIEPETTTPSLCRSELDGHHDDIGVPSAREIPYSPHQSVPSTNTAPLPATCLATAQQEQPPQQQQQQLSASFVSPETINTEVIATQHGVQPVPATIASAALPEHSTIQQLSSYSELEATVVGMRKEEPPRNSTSTDLVETSGFPIKSNSTMHEAPEVLLRSEDAKDDVPKNEPSRNNCSNAEAPDLSNSTTALQQHSSSLSSGGIILTAPAAAVAGAIPAPSSTTRSIPLHIANIANPQPSNIKKKRHRPNVSSTKKSFGSHHQPSATTTSAGSSNNNNNSSTGRWTSSEHQAFLAGLATYGREWKRVAMHIPTRTSSQVRSHAQKYFFKLQQQQQQASAQAAAAQASATSASHLSSSSAAHSILGGGYDMEGSSSALQQQQDQQNSNALLSPSVRANVERILAQPESVQAEVDETLQRLRERYLVLQRRLRQQQQLQRANGGGDDNHGNNDKHRPGRRSGGSSLLQQHNYNNDHSSLEDSLQDSELIALHVLQGGLEQSSRSRASSSSSASSASSASVNPALEEPTGVSASEALPEDSTSPEIRSLQDQKDPDTSVKSEHDGDDDEGAEDDGHNPQAPPSKRSKTDHPSSSGSTSNSMGAPSHHRPAP